MKYNYSLEYEVQNFSCFDAFIRLSPDFKTLEIHNMKPVPNDKYILEADPTELEKMRIIEEIIKIEVKVHKKDEETVKRDLLELTKHFDIAEMNELLDEVKEEARLKSIKLE